MNWKRERIVALSTGTILLLGIALVWSQGHYGVREQNSTQTQASYGDFYAGGDRTIAATVLESDDPEMGWGRVVVMDLVCEESLERVVVVNLYDLGEEQTYRLLFNPDLGDESVLGPLATDSNGDAWARFSTFGGGGPAPPEELPAADALVSAALVDEQDLVILRGEFKLMIQGGGGNSEISYLDRITLDPTPGLADHGMARVAVDTDGSEIFQSAGCGLVPHASYHVYVNGSFLAGVVTADGLGQASLVLSTKDESLPEDMSPVSELGEVKWTTDDGVTVVLIGSFSGTNMLHGGGGSQGGDGGGGDGGGGGGGGGGGEGGEGGDGGEGGSGGGGGGGRP